jgi:hypothetical protein
MILVIGWEEGCKMEYGIELQCFTLSVYQAAKEHFIMVFTSDRL